jgi:glutathione S-transferase
MRATCVCAGRWKRRDRPIALQTRLSALGAPNNFSHQPFGQVPWLSDGEISIFESGAILLHLCKLNEALMPVDPLGGSKGTQCVDWTPSRGSFLV